MVCFVGCALREMLVFDSQEVVDSRDERTVRLAESAMQENIMALTFGPDLLDDAGFDLGVEFGMRGVLVGKQLAQQAFECAAELGAHGRARRQRRVERLELLVCHERVGYGVPRLGADSIGHFEL